jgi:NhaP-type Na+/H+ or K+/H+ antiporter
MEPYIVVLAGFGAVVLMTAWLPMALKELPLSLPIFCVALGAVLFSFPDIPGIAPRPQENLALTERLTEAVVIISLMGAGLKIDRPFDLGSWRMTWRLLLFSMPLTIGALALLGHYVLGLNPAAALLLGAALAPTDPVLASDVQVGPPSTGRNSDDEGRNEDETRFSLTSEAGLNDGLAFPFVKLALAAAAASQADASEAWLSDWFTEAVLWRILAGVAMGYAVGWALGWLTFRIPNRAKLSRTGDGFVALGVTALAYGLTEMVHGYGFLAVFVAALALRSMERGHHYHEKLHEFAEELERLLMMILLVMLGGALAAGGLLSALSWEVFAFALLAIFVVRPLSGWIGLLGSRCPPVDKAVVSFFGIRGLGSFYYVAYALGHGSFENPDLLWTAVSLVVLISIFLHGATVTPAMRYADRLAGRTPPGDGPADKDDAEPAEEGRPAPAE